MEREGVVEPMSLLGRQSSETDGPEDETVSKARGEDPGSSVLPMISDPSLTASRGED